MQQYGRTANRILAAALLLSLGATIYLVAENSDWYWVGMLSILGSAIGLAALPAVAFALYARRPEAAELSKPMRSAVIFSGLVLSFAGSAFIYLLGASLWAVVAALVGAFGVWTVIRAWRAPPSGDQNPKLAYGGSTVVGFFFVLIAIVAIPKFGCGCSSTPYYTAAMKSDLRNLTTSEDLYFADHGRYASAGELQDSLFRATTGVTIVEIVAHDTSSWYARLRHSASPEECGVWIGAKPPVDMHDAREGEPKCWPAPASSL